MSFRNCSKFLAFFSLLVLAVSNSQSAVTQIANDVVFNETIAELMMAGETWKYENGDVYTGAWLHNKPHGKGTYTRANGDVYTGDFKNGFMDGAGVYKFSNGDVYDGHMKQGLSYGFGTMTFQSGNRYVGEWKAGLRHGKGKLQYRSGSVFDGYWENDNRNGKGLMVHRNGQRYIGDYKNNEPHGHGIQTESDGSVYRGTFSKGVKHGVGECTQDGGMSQVCLFDKGREIRDPGKLELAADYYKKNRPQFEFKGGIAYQLQDEFTKARQYVSTKNVWWEKKIALLETQLRIRSEKGDNYLFLVVNRYTGPGVYHLRKGEILASNSDGMRMELPEDIVARVEIKSDENNEVHGVFSIPQLAGQENLMRYQIFDGQFEAKSQPQAPIKYREFEDFLAKGATFR